MTNIGPITLTYYNVYSLSDYSVNLAGFFTTAQEREELRELCADSRSTSVHEAVGGGIIAEDSSDGAMLIQYCQFDEDQYIDGWYIITSFNYSPEAGWPNYYPWSMTLAFIGTTSDYMEGYDLGNIREVPNDWEP